MSYTEVAYLASTVGIRKDKLFYIHGKVFSDKHDITDKIPKPGKYLVEMYCFSQLLGLNRGSLARLDRDISDSDPQGHTKKKVI